MSKTETYNGWKNYPTWAVNLWLANDEGLHDATREIVTNAKAGSFGGNDPYPDTPRVEVAGAIKTWVCEALAPDLGATFAADLLGYALDQVDWFDIADAWLEE